MASGDRAVAPRDRLPEPKPSLCLEMLFTDLPFIGRMKAAARVGYRAVEFWDWRGKDLDEVRRAALDLGLQISTFSGNRLWTLTQPSQRVALLEELKGSLEVAARLDCHYLMLLTDRLNPRGHAVPWPEELPGSTKLDSVRDTLAAAAELARGSDVTLLLEPLNTAVDHPGYFLDSSRVAFDVVSQVNSPRVRVLYDVYHMSVMGEDVCVALEKGYPWLGYLHVADVPGRHEPGTGTVGYSRILGTLRRLGYASPIGMEFSASASSEAAARRALELVSVPPSGASA